jgi:large subunit ribosomal protein L14e
VQPGRVAYINFGKDAGKMVVIVDIADANRVLVDTPNASFPRVLYPLKRLTLTTLKVPKILRGARTGTLKKAASEFKLSEKWAASSTAKKFALRKRRADLTDFDRFKVMIKRKNRSYQVRKLAKKIGASAGGAKGKADQKKGVPAQKQAPAKKGGK